MVNYHTHTNHSPDANGSLDDVINKAIENGIKYLAITDHYDQECGPASFMVDLPVYYQALVDAKEKYKEKITIAIGIELGIQEHLLDDHRALLAKYPFDFVLASQHCINREDFSCVFEDRGIDMQREYILTLTRMVKVLDGIHSIGHIDLLKRYFPSINHLEEQALKKEWDLLFQALVERGIGIELNTSGKRKGLKDYHPSRELLTWYYEAGGRIITVGADSHTPGDVLEGIEDALELLKTVGFQHFSVFNKGKEEQIVI